jgi:hypothetical protein
MQENQRDPYMRRKLYMVHFVLDYGKAFSDDVPFYEFNLR